MRITRSGDAPGYQPPGHTGVSAHRLQGLEAGGPPGFWVGLSDYPPGAAAELSPVAGDTVYVILDGELEISTEAGRTTLEIHDSAFLAAGEVRAVRNATGRPAQLLVILQPQPPAGVPAGSGPAPAGSS